MDENYLGYLQNKSLINSLFANGFNNSTIFVLSRLELYPCKANFKCSGDGLPYHQAISILNEFGYKESTVIKKYRKLENSLYERRVIVELNDNIFVDLYGSPEEREQEPFGDVHVLTEVNIFYLPGSEETVKCILNKFREVLIKPIKRKAIEMIIEYYGYESNDDEPVKKIGFKTIKVKDPKITYLKLHYGKRFLKTHDTIMNTLNQETTNKGNLILLHGLPGTGKTHYIRYLINNLDRQFIYMSTDMVQKLSDPEIVSFLLNQQNSIIIVEDAENIIKHRTDSESETQATANLLNLTDGLLGDSLQHTVIATFNCELSSIDPALLRKGRLVSIHEFDKLTLAEAQKLSDHLGFTSIITEPMTLADIYAQGK